MSVVGVAITTTDICGVIAEVNYLLSTYKNFENFLVAMPRTK